MFSLIDNKTALSVYLKYFSNAEKTGYVEPALMKKYMMYSFFTDLVNEAHIFFDEEDYDIVGQALAKLFTGGGCLFPYPVFCTNRATLGSSMYMGNLRIRKSEDASGYQDRYTEDDILRTV